MSTSTLCFASAPYRLSGVVIGSLLNHAAALAALGASISEPPYKAAPKGPILYVKPRNTWSENGADVALPSTADRLEIGASLGLVIGRTACAVDEAHALDHVAGYTLVADLSVPHDSFYRPSIRFRALDGSCFVGPRVALRHEIANPDDIAIHVSLNGQRVHTASTAGMVRSARRLIADVSDFMTLHPGDILMLGIAAGAPQSRAGDAFAIESAAIGQLDGHVIAEAAREVT